MKALVVLSAVIAVVLSVPANEKQYVNTGAYTWQPPKYYNAYNSGRYVYSGLPWYQAYQSTTRPVLASTLSPWQFQGKSKYSFGSALTSAAVQPKIIDESVPTVEAVQAVPAAPKVPSKSLPESEETLKELQVEELNEKSNKTSLVIEKSNIELEQLTPEVKPLLVAEPKPIEIKSEVVAPVVVKKKHGFSFSYNPSLNVYNRNPLPVYSQAQPTAAVVPEIKPIVIQAVQPAIESKPTLLPTIVESNEASIAPVSSTIETLEATTENIQTTEFVQPAIESKPTLLPTIVESNEAPIAPVSSTIETLEATTENIQTTEFVVPTIDISQPIIQYDQYSSVPSTAEYIVPTADISQPIIQYALPSEENASTTIEPALYTTESVSSTPDYASEYSPINTESINALLSSLEATTEPALAQSYEYLSTESETTTTEGVSSVTTELSSTTVQSQPEDIESIPITESSVLLSEPLISSVQSVSTAGISSQSFSYSSTPSIVKKKHGFSFSYSPSGYVYNKEASLVLKPTSDISEPEVPSTASYLQPVVSTVIPSANIWSNSYNAKKNSFSFSYNPSFSYFNKQSYYQPQVASGIWSVPSVAPVVSSPAVVPLTIESLSVSKEDAQSSTTESSPSEATTLNIEYGTTESEEKAPIVLELASTTAESNVDVTTSNSALIEPLPSIPESSEAVVEASSSSTEILPVTTEPASFVTETEEPTTEFNEISTENAEFQYSTTESYLNEATTLAIDSNEYLSTTQTAPASINLVSAAIESSIKEALKEQITIESIPQVNVPDAIEIASVTIKPENISQSSSLALESASAVSSPVLIESAPAAIASVQAVPIPLYVKEVTKVSPPAAFPAFQPTFATKKYGFSFSYKPSGNYYKKAEVTAPVAPAIVESSPVIASVAPAIVESSPVIASVAPAIVESSPVIASVAPAIVESSSVIASVAPALAQEASQEVVTRPSLLLSLYNAVKSAVLEYEKPEISAEVIPEIHLSPCVAEPQKLNSEADLSSQYDIAVKSSPISPELKEDV